LKEASSSNSSEHVQTRVDENQIHVVATHEHTPVDIHPTHSGEGERHEGNHDENHGENQDNNTSQRNQVHADSELEAGSLIESDAGSSSLLFSHPSPYLTLNDESCGCNITEMAR
jgi:hypothetical protein